MAFALPVGNAIQLVLNPPPSAADLRILRNTTGSFTGPNTAGATLVADQFSGGEVFDINDVVNGTLYHYAVYYRDAFGVWIPGAAGSDEITATPAATFAGQTTDVQVLLKNRLEVGLAAEVLANRLKPSPKTNRVEVVMAPFVLSDHAAFPMVSVHLEHREPAFRSLGEWMGADRKLAAGGWRESAGWMARTVLSISGVAHNPGERARLRSAIERIVISNFAVLDAAGIILPELHQRDHEVGPGDEYNTPLFFTLGTLSCVAPAFATGDVGEIESVEVEAFWTGEGRE